MTELSWRCDHCGGALEMRWGYPRCIKCGLGDQKFKEKLRKCCRELEDKV